MCHWAPSRFSYKKMVSSSGHGIWWFAIRLRNRSIRPTMHWIWWVLYSIIIIIIFADRHCNSRFYRTSCSMLISSRILWVFIAGCRGGSRQCWHLQLVVYIELEYLVVGQGQKPSPKAAGSKWSKRNKLPIIHVHGPMAHTSLKPLA